MEKQLLRYSGNGYYLAIKRNTITKDRAEYTSYYSIDKKF